MFTIFLYTARPEPIYRPIMSKQLTIDFDDDLFERAKLVADNRGISLEQLVIQHLERASAQDEYLRLQQIAAQQKQTARVARPPQRAQKKRATPVSPRTQMHKNART